MSKKAVKIAPEKNTINQMAIESLITLIIEQFIRTTRLVSRGEIGVNTSIELKNWYLGKTPEEKDVISGRILGDI